MVILIGTTERIDRHLSLITSGGSSTATLPFKNKVLESQNMIHFFKNRKMSKNTKLYKYTFLCQSPPPKFLDPSLIILILHNPMYNTSTCTYMHTQVLCTHTRVQENIIITEEIVSQKL